MKNTKTFYRRATVRKGREIVVADIVMEIDLDALARLLGSKAINNKNGRSTLSRGHIKVRATVA